MSTKRKAATAIAKPVVRQNAKAPVKTKIDESRTAVSTGLAPKPLSKQSAEAEPTSDAASQYGSSDDDEDDNVASDEESKNIAQKTITSRQKRSQDAADVDAVMQDGSGGDTSDGEPAAPTFGDLARGNSTIDVTASLAAATHTKSSQQQLALQRRQQPAAASAPLSATSLGTVLNQALRTDDADLLESCLHTTDVKIIENTINRMDSALAGTLLSKLAARMHRRPGRAFGLMRWMQWTLVAHGGALAAQPDLVARLGELSRVLEERSRGLGSLLALKGKLDMLDSQMKFRKAVKTGGVAGVRGRGRGEDGYSDEEEDEEEEDVDAPGVVYVEGQEALGGARALTNGSAAGRGGAGVVDDEDDFPAGGDALSDSEEEDDEDFEEMEEDLAGAESLDEDEVDHDDVEEDEEEEEEEESEGEEARPPAKVRRTSARISKRS